MRRAGDPFGRAFPEQGTAVAQYNLGVEYMNGLGVPQDYAQAVAWGKPLSNMAMLRHCHTREE